MKPRREEVLAYWEQLRHGKQEMGSHLINSNFLLVKKVEILLGFSASVFLSLLIWGIVFVVLNLLKPTGYVMHQQV
jgi:hypothetical protein